MSRPGTKLALVVALLKRKEGCTTADVLKTTGWPAVSMPQQAKAAGLTLTKEKDRVMNERHAEFSHALDTTIVDFISHLGVTPDYAAALLRAKADALVKPKQRKGPASYWRAAVPLIEGAARRPMDEAPRDGTVILLERYVSGMGKLPKDTIVGAKWTPNQSPGGHDGHWTLLLEWSSAGGQDDKYLGWWPMPNEGSRHE